MNIGMITQGAVRFQTVRQNLLRQGHRCQSYAFLSTFMASSHTMLYDCIVLSWEVSGKDTPEVVRLLREELPGDVNVAVVNIPSTVEITESDPQVKYLRPMSSRDLLEFLTAEYLFTVPAGNVVPFPQPQALLLKAV